MTDSTGAVAHRREEWISVVNQGDLEGYGRLVSKGVVWLPPTGEVIEGRTAFLEWLTPFFRQYDFVFEVEPYQFRAFSRWCAESGKFRSTLSAKGTDQAQEHEGRYFVLWHLDEDDVWRIERYVDGIGREDQTPT